MTFSLAEAVTFGALQFVIDYSRIAGTFFGSAGAVSCTRLAGDFGAFNDMDAQQQLSVALISIAGVTGPVPLGECEFATLDAAAPDAGDFQVTVTDASDVSLQPIVPTPSLTVTVVQTSSATSTSSSSTSTSLP